MTTEPNATVAVEQSCPKCAASRIPCDEHYRRDAAPIAAECIMPNCRSAAPAGDAFCSRHRNAVAMMDHKPSPKVTFDLAPPAIELPSTSVPNWADQRLARAYALISAVSDEHSSEGDIWPLLKAALDAVEKADCKLESGE